MRQAPEVLVVGGGPAGCAAARLLSLWRHYVLLVTTGSSNPHTLPESLPPSCGKLFDAIGVRDAIDSAGFVRSTGHTVWWERGEPRVEWFAAGERGWQVTAPALESLLQTAARDAGARVDSSRLSYEQAVESGASFILDCTGRTGLVARARGWRVTDDRHTVALVGRWQWSRVPPLPDATHTVIESYENGWAWSIPDAAGGRFVAVMVDPEVSSLARGVTSEAVYRAEVGKTRQLRAMLDTAALLEGPVGWDATTYRASRLHDDRMLLAGDAASFVDPLSSAGVQKALASGWLAAVAVHTSLLHPQMRDLALAFFHDRETEMFEALSTRAHSFLSNAASERPEPFWATRTSEIAGELTQNPAHGHPEAVRTAHERLRRAATTRFSVAAGLTVESRPGIAGCEIVLEPRIVTQTHPRGVRYLHDIDLVALIELAPGSRQVPDLFDAYQRRCGPASLPGFLTALSTLVAERWLWLEDD